MLWVLWLTYGSFYFCRNNLGVALPGIEAELGYSKYELGTVLMALKLAYGAGQFINGQLAERIAPRKLLAIGLLASAALSAQASLSAFLKASAAIGFSLSMKNPLADLLAMINALLNLSLPPQRGHGPTSSCPSRRSVMLRRASSLARETARALAIVEEETRIVMVCPRLPRDRCSAGRDARACLRAACRQRATGRHNRSGT